MATGRARNGLRSCHGPRHQACFDSIDHTALMDRVRNRVTDKRVLALVKAFLKAGVMTETGVPESSETGTPQGGIIWSLLLG